jgi:serine/threonine protein kinase
MASMFSPESMLEPADEYTFCNAWVVSHMGTSDEERQRARVMFDMRAESLVIEKEPTADSDDSICLGVSRSGSRALEFSEICLSWSLGNDQSQLAVEIEHLGNFFRETGYQPHFVSEKRRWVGMIALILEGLDASRFLRVVSSAGIVQRCIKKVWDMQNATYAASGACGDVYIARGPGGVQGAIKTIKIPTSSSGRSLAEKRCTEFANECRMFKLMQGSEYTPRLYGAFVFIGKENEELNVYLSIAMQYLEVSLLSLRAACLFGELELRPIMEDIICGTKYMHAKSFAHRDIKIGNVMLKSTEGPAYLIDYGFSARVTPRRATMRPYTSVGSPGYLAPEVFRDPGWDYRSQDIFALGCVAYNLVSAVPVFGGENQDEVFIANRSGQVSYESLENLSREFRVTVRSMLRTNLSKRITADEALQSPWFRLRPERLMHTPLLPCHPHWALQQRAKERVDSSDAVCISPRDENCHGSAITLRDDKLSKDAAGNSPRAPEAVSSESKRSVLCGWQKAVRLNLAQYTIVGGNGADSWSQSPKAFNDGVRGDTLVHRLFQRGRKLFSCDAETAGDTRKVVDDGACTELQHSNGAFSKVCPSSPIEHRNNRQNALWKFLDAEEDTKPDVEASSPCTPGSPQELASTSQNPFSQFSPPATEGKIRTSEEVFDGDEADSQHESPKDSPKQTPKEANDGVRGATIYRLLQRGRLFFSGEHEVSATDSLTPEDITPSPLFALPISRSCASGRRSRCHGAAANGTVSPSAIESPVVLAADYTSIPPLSQRTMLRHRR